MKWLQKLFGTWDTYAVEQTRDVHGRDLFLVVWADTRKPVPGEPAFAKREDAEAHVRTLEARLGE